MASFHNQGIILQSAVRSYIKPFTAEMHAYGKGRLGKLFTSVFLYLYWYLWYEANGGKCWKSCAFILSFCLSESTPDFSAGCKSSRSLCANARSVRALTHCSSWVPTSHTWGACPVLCVFLIHGICHALISAIPAPWPFLQQRTMLQIQGTAACGWDRGFSSLNMVSKSTTLASSLAAWRTASAFVCFIQNL